MRKKKIMQAINIGLCVLLAATVAVTGLYLFTDWFRFEEAEAGTVYTKGSTGSVVKQIQTALKNKGYYTGAIDGIFGTKTATAVKKYQSAVGLKADGIVGSATAKSLGVSLSGNITSSNIDLLARVIYGEARGEPYIGQVAVGAVVLNRVASSSFPNTVSGVIYQTGAFDAVSDGQINLTPDSTAKQAATDAMNGWDPTGGCLYYYNPKTATSKWMLAKEVHLSIGNHSFCL